MTEQKKVFLSIDDIMEIVPVHKRTLQRYLQEKRIPAQKIFGRWMVRMEDWERFVSPPTEKENI